MDEFLSGLTNYTEKGNPYHSIDAYLGTEFAETETILKLFYPLIAFQFENGLRIILTNGLIKEIFGKIQFRYYLNYMILPKIEKYRNSLPKLSDMKNDLATLSSMDYSKENYKEEYMKAYFPGVDYEKDYQAYKQLRNQIPKTETTEFQKRVLGNQPIVHASVQERYSLREYLRYKVNNHAKNLSCIKKVIDTLIHFDTHFDTSLQKIENYLRVIQFAGIHELIDYL